jgi:hypothetical protein
MGEVQNTVMILDIILLAVLCIAQSEERRPTGWTAGVRLFSSSEHTDRLCGPPSLLFDGYRSDLPVYKAAGAFNCRLTCI